MRVWRWLVALALLVFGRRRRKKEADQASERIVAAGTPERQAENWVLFFLGLAIFFAAGFIVVYVVYSPNSLHNALLGLALAGSLASIGMALTVVAKRLVVTEEIEDEYPSESPQAQREVAEIIHESGSRITRKRLLLGAGAVTGGALTVAALTPVVSIGPIWDTGPLDRTPWKRGVRVVNEAGTPILAADVLPNTFYTAFAQGASPEDWASAIVMARVDPSQLRLPPGREGWAPGGIVAYSKICTHAGCAIALYRKPTFPVVEPQPAFVCPCHYSTFDPYTGGTVIYGPAGRPLPQLPLMVDSSGYLAAAGNYSARVGPSWWNVRSRPT